MALFQLAPQLHAFHQVGVALMLIFHLPLLASEERLVGGSLAAQGALNALAVNWVQVARPLDFLETLLQRTRVRLQNAVVRTAHERAAHHSFLPAC